MSSRMIAQSIDEEVDRTYTEGQALEMAVDSRPTGDEQLRDFVAQMMDRASRGELTSAPTLLRKRPGPMPAPPTPALPPSPPLTPSETSDVEPNIDPLAAPRLKGVAPELQASLDRAEAVAKNSNERSSASGYSTPRAQIDNWLSSSNATTPRGEPEEERRRDLLVPAAAPIKEGSIRSVASSSSSTSNAPSIPGRASSRKTASATPTSPPLDSSAQRSPRSGPNASMPTATTSTHPSQSARHLAPVVEDDANSSRPSSAQSMRSDASGSRTGAEQEMLPGSFLKSGAGRQSSDQSVTTLKDDAQANTWGSTFGNSLKRVSTITGVAGVASWAWGTSPTSTPESRPAPLPKEEPSAPLPIIVHEEKEEKATIEKVEAVSVEPPLRSPVKEEEHLLVETEHGDAFDVPEDLMDEFKRVMASLGPQPEDWDGKMPEVTLESYPTSEGPKKVVTEVKTVPVPAKVRTPVEEVDRDQLAPLSATPVSPRRRSLQPLETKPSSSSSASGSSRSPSSPLPLNTGNLKRAPSVMSNESTKSKKRFSFFSFGASPSSPNRRSRSLTPSVLTSPLPEDEPDIVDYTTGRSQKRKDSHDENAENVPVAAGRPRKSSIAKPAANRRPQVYNVRFANATRGLGLRTIADQEAQGGDELATRWIGVGMGHRYGLHVLKEGENGPEIDERYAKQAEIVKKKWRAYGSSVQNAGWSAVKID